MFVDFDEFYSGVYGFYVTFTYTQLLKGADALQLEKPIKPELGGGFKVFHFNEIDFYEGKLKFFSKSFFLI